MGIKSVYSAFTSGEISEEFFSRSDLARFGFGLARMENYFVDYRGGAVSRHGYEYCFPCPATEGQPRFFRFRGTDVDLLLVFNNTRMRVVKNGGYVLQASKAITSAPQANPMVITSAAHGYSIGDLVYITSGVGMSELSGRYFRLSAVTTDTFTLDSPDAEPIDGTGYSAYVSGGTVARVYTLTMPYDTASLPFLRFEQRLNTVYITSSLYPPRQLVYTSDTSWAVSLVGFVPGGRPSGLSASPSAAGTAGAGYCVTAVRNGVESLPSNTLLETLANNADGTSIRLEWTHGSPVDYYNVYRTEFNFTGAMVTKGDPKGFIARVTSSNYSDTLTIPDFTKVPPRAYTPFTAGAIAGIEVTARGTGYATSDTVAMTDANGTGFQGELIVNNGGRVVGVNIIHPGSGYTSPSLVITTAGGSGATFSITRNPATGVNPETYKSFQQRGVWAGTDNNPITVWGSRPGEPNNLSFSTILSAEDGYNYTLDVQAVKPIKHMEAIRSGLLLFTEAGVTQLLPSSGKVITPLNAVAEEQAFLPVSDMNPIRIGLDVLFGEEDGASLQAMQYTEYTETFQLQDIAVLSSHLIAGDGKPSKMVYWSAPHKLIYLLREDGTLALCTYDRGQEIFGWAQQTTRGVIRDVDVVRDADGEVPYVLVERYINGRWRYFGERAVTRLITLDEDAFCVDCGLQTVLTKPSFTIRFAAFEDTTTCTASGGVFTADDVGKVIFAGGGKFLIETFQSSTVVDGVFLRPLTRATNFGTVIPYEFRGLQWKIGTPVTSLGGLWHLEGETVSVQADGDAFIDKVVTNGTVTLDFEATKVVVGLAYYCDLKSLPVTSSQVMIEGEDKRVMGVNFRRVKSRGLFVGPTLDSLHEVKERTSDVFWGDSLGLSSEMEEISLDPGFDYDAQVCFRQIWPLPSTITGLVFDLEVSE